MMRAKPDRVQSEQGHARREERWGETGRDGERRVEIWIEWVRIANI